MVTDRRSFLKWLGLSPVGGSLVKLPNPGDVVFPIPDHLERSEGQNQPSEPAVAEVETTRRSLSWVQHRLREHYGSRYYQQPNKGIFHHYPDVTYDLLTKESFLTLSQGYQPQLISGDKERFDCDEYATGLRWMFLTGGFGQFPATNMVGQAHNFAGNHVYNVVLCAGGEILEWEPQTNTLTSEVHAPKEYYNFKNGILYL